MQNNTAKNLKPYIKIEGPEQPVGLHDDLIKAKVEDEVQKLEDVRTQVDTITHSIDPTIQPNTSGNTQITYPGKSRKFLEKLEFKKGQEKVHEVNKKIEAAKPKNIFQRAREKIQERMAA